MLLGPTGVGKEVVAHAIHAASDRAAGPFRAINCAAIPADLAESILFGHVTGAFTGAVSDSPGEFAEAHGGTLFLDEVGEMPLALQAKLLRVLEERVVRPVGATAERTVDVRILSATNRDLLEAVKAGRFREDLYYRLAVVPLTIPPLAERPEDLLPLARTFAEEAAGGETEVEITPAAARLLASYPWPGNVRELSNVIQRAVYEGDGRVIRAEDIRFDGTVRVAEPGAGPAGAELYERLQAEPGSLDLLECRNRYGAEVLREVLRRAILATPDLRAAGRRLGFVPEEDPADRAYNNLRAWMRRLGLSRRQVLREAGEHS
jgi:transcriptional regulator with PAS, ATPase and Fis domain